jgi:quercetin 2,3-dioxygenase
VVQSVALGAPPWPTVDPFLFCVHHVDHYPAGDGSFAPDRALLAGRDIGSDFSGRDGWSMYHGSAVPGFPQHPHRGFETVTVVRSGLIDHSDSLGAAARFGVGDAQWLTAGNGIVHSEMFPLLKTDAANPLELFQIWLNLPAADKLVEPYFTMLWADALPHVVETDEHGRHTVIDVVAGALHDHTPPAPPPNSWAARPDADVAIWQLRLDPHARWTMPAPASSETVRILYVFGGDGIGIGGHAVDAMTANVVDSGATVELTAGSDAADVLVLQGRPIGEPVAQHGPFVMNHRAEIEQAFRDYQRTQFGGWPWDADGPVHGADPGRFARHPDGRVERPAGSAHAA